MFSKFTEDAQKVLLGAKKEMQNLKHPYVGSEHLLLSILKNHVELKKKLAEFHIYYDNFRDKLIEFVGIGKEENHWFLYTPLLRRVIETATLMGKEINNGEVNSDHLFLSILEEGDGIAFRILGQLGVDTVELQEYFSSRTIIRKKKGNRKLVVEDYGVDLTKKASSHELDPVVGRDDEISRVIEILCRRTKNNPLLIGEAGVGKTAIVEELARRIYEKKVPEKLYNKRILSVSIATLVAGTKYRGEFEERLTKMLGELEKEDSLILFIDEVHTLMGAGGAEGAIDAANIFKPALARGKIKLIGATTTEEYKQTIEKDKAIARRFQTVSINEPEDDTVFAILTQLRPLYEDFHHVKVSDEILKKIIFYTNRYIDFRKQPDKSIDILDEVCSRVSLSGNKKHQQLGEYQKQYTELIEKKNQLIINQNFEEASKLKVSEKTLLSKIHSLELRKDSTSSYKNVRLEDIFQVLYSKTKIPIYDGNIQNGSFLQLEKKLNIEVQGQSKAIEQLMMVTKKIQLGFHDSKRPPSFLFVGPSGVGKTLLAKKYSELLFGSNQLIRFDMSEYSDSSSVSKIIGSNPGYVGYDDCKNRLEEIRNQPHAVILFDEIEKAHPSVLNLFLQILDEGELADSKGNVVSFRHHVIIITSNLGFQKAPLGFSSEKSHVKRNVQEFLSVELMNRIDQIIQFSNMEKKTIESIIKEKLKQAKNQFKDKGIELHFNRRMVSQILELCEYSEFGARRIDKIIEDKVNNLVIEQILRGKNEVYLEKL